MRTSHQAALIAASAVLLTACASSGGMASSQPASSYHPPEKVTRDERYVAMVERVARRRGVKVHWINPPTRRVDAAGQADEAGDQ